MIRSINPSDTGAVMALAEKLGMFDIDGLEHIRETLAVSYNGTSNDLWFVVDDNGLAGVVYCASEPMTRGTWNVLMLLVSPNHQGQGHGNALMSSVEQTLVERGERLLIVETSSLDDFEGARVFYSKCGYDQEARIRDFYAAGEDKIIFSKALKTG
jgi:ribosomal protein S18 acetylase RimI-like enzyme